MKKLIILTALAAALSSLAYAQPSPVYPSAVATTNDLLCAVNNISTTLNGSIDSSQTTLTMTDGTILSSCSSGFAFTIDTEAIRCTTRATHAFSGCTRGFDGTTAASHSNSTPVRGLNLARHHNQTAAEVIALETALGVGFGGSNGIWARTAAGVWAARTLTGTSGEIVVTNGDGVSGNPTFSIGSDIAKKSDSSGVPSGLVAFFAVSSCPTGWAEYTALRGRYGVGLVSGGTLEGTSGTALTNQESRPVGQHSHTVTDPGHFHTQSIVGSSAFGTLQAQSGGAYEVAGSSTGSNTTGITIANSGSVAGTNAPYIQLLACKKN